MGIEAIKATWSFLQHETFMCFRQALVFMSEDKNFIFELSCIKVLKLNHVTRC